MTSELSPTLPAPISAPPGQGLLPYGLPDPTAQPLLPAPHSIQIQAFQHVAIRVADLQAAESFYREFFGMEVVWRVRRAREQWEFLPADYDWESGFRLGIVPQFVLVKNGPLALLLQYAGRGTVFAEPRLLHLSIAVSSGTLATLKAEVLIRGFPIAENREHSFVFRDPFGLTWHLTDAASSGDDAHET